MNTQSRKNKTRRRSVKEQTMKKKRELIQVFNEKTENTKESNDRKKERKKSFGQHVIYGQIEHQLLV